MRRKIHPPALRAPAFAGVLALLAVLGASGGARAEPASAAPRAGAEPPIAPDASGARALYDAGTKAFNEARYVEAALDFEAAASRKPSPVALYGAAMAWERANVPERAADDYAAALAMPGLDAASATSGTQRLATLRAALGAVVVTAPAGVRVQLDGNSEWPVPAALHGGPGVHTLTLRSGGRTPSRSLVVLRLGEATTLDLSHPAAAAAAAQPSAPGPLASVPAPRPSETLKTVGGVAIGAAGAVLLGGLLLGAEAMSAKNVYTSAPTRAAYDHASNLQTWTNVAYASGGTLLALGVVFVLWPSPHTPVAVAGARGGGGALWGVER
jgi:hypothetical protein